MAKLGVAKNARELKQTVSMKGEVMAREWDRRLRWIGNLWKKKENGIVEDGMILCLERRGNVGFSAGINDAKEGFIHMICWRI